MEESLKQHSSSCIRVVFFGPESTGKTSLAKGLAEIYQTRWVPEFAREYLEEKLDRTGEICAPEDIWPIENRLLLPFELMMYVILISI